MSRTSHLVVSLFFFLLLVTWFLPHPTSSQSTVRSLSLNGTNQYLTTPSSTSLNITGAITVEAWIKLNSIGAYQIVLSREAFAQPGTGGGYRLTISNSGKVQLDLFQSHNTYVTLIGATTATAGVWHHVAGVFDGSQMRVYLDGVLDGSLATTSGPAAGTGVFYVGRHSYATSPFYFGGLIDEVRVSAAALYTSNFTRGLGPSANVRGFWKFDGQTANDFSGNGNHGTLQNGATYSTDVPPVTNNAPTVSLTDPQNNTTFAAGSNIVLDATAGDSDGSVSRVDFYQGTTLLGTDTSAPYTFVWSNVAGGVYSLTAKAMDDGGAVTTSTAIAVTVIAPGGNHSLSMNGSNQYLIAASSESLNITGPVTVEAWIKLNSIGAYQIVLSREAFGQPGTGGGYRLTISNAGKVQLDLFQSHNTYVTVIGTTTATTGVWHHVAGVFDGSQMRVYLDGVLDGSLATTSGPAAGTGAFYIGRHSYATSPFYFGGLIDEVGVSAEALYTNNFTPGLGPGSSVRGFWKFDGQTANDFSGNGNHGTLQNGATYSTTVPPSGGSQRPVAFAGGPYSSPFGQAVSFSSSGSFDPDGTIVSYHWNFGDGTSANTANPSHAYAAPGIYTATLTVADNAGLRTSAIATVTISAATNARLDPLNQTGGGTENPLSRNFHWMLPLVSLPGRAGLDLSLSLSYNSLVWTKNGNYVSFDDDHGFPGPGFRLGFPVIQPLYYNPETARYAFLLIASDGSRVELRQVPATNFYESADSSHLLLDATTMVLRTTDGTQLKYELKGSEYNCTELKDRNGNYITVNYTSFGRIDNVVDTLGRSVQFNYDANGWLTSITQAWNQGAVTHNWATFDYGVNNTSIQTNFSGLTVSGPSNSTSIKTLKRVTLADGSHYDFSWTSWGQVWKISSFAADNHLLNYRSYNLPQTSDPQTPYSDCPRFTERRDWAQYWNGDTDGLAVISEEVVTAFTPAVSDTWTMPDATQQTGMRVQVTAPDGTSNKIYFIGTAGTGSGWRRGLPALVNAYDSEGTLRRQVLSTWTQDNTAVSYVLNPRVTETNTFDPEGNRARVQITYQPVSFANGTSCQLPRDVYEYAANATDILRSTRTIYNTNAVYTDRRIIGLVSEKQLYEGNINNGGTLMSKLAFFYDESGSLQGADAPVQHDNTNYSAAFVTGRANLSSVKRYDVTNLSSFTTTRTKYNTAGAVVSSIDALNHAVQISYSDSFSDRGNLNTLAYPTTVADADGYVSTTKYDYDFGAVTYNRTPKPNTTDLTESLNGPEQTLTYDSIGRLQQTTNLVNNAYTRFEYPTSQTRVDTYVMIQEGQGEAHSFKITDGAGRLIATATDHPGSVGGFSGQRFVYDVLGRTVKTSNPAETTADGPPSQWITAGDDAASGWIYTQQTYDWKSRPRITTNQDGTTKSVSYSGCGCAGGEVVTLTDEGTIDAGVVRRRQQKIYTDILGRPYKTETLNWAGGSVYSTTVASYNARDQVTQVREYAGPEDSNTYQDTIIGYDGFGRLQSKHVPEQNAGTATLWSYNADDTINTITDARGAVTTFGYTGTNRHLVKTVTHALSGTPTINVAFEYDAVGNRTSMTDALGSVVYNRDLLSQLTSETRTIAGVGSFTLNYAYNLSGQLTSVTDPFGAQVGYGHDKLGRLSAITGANFGSVTSYASDFQYRAWGALKSLSYGNSKTVGLGYDVKLNVSTYEIPGLMKKSYQYYNDGRLRFTQDQLFTNSRFDRFYKYDHLGRITSALSGAEARGQGPTNDRPYNETMAYDPMGHLTLREIRQWDRYDTTGNETYINNRRQYWQYDADGRLLHGNSDYIYDAAGQISSFGDADPYMTDQQFDGDGHRLKTVQRSYNPTTHQWTTEKVTYYVHSSVLGA
ncbi:MAG TPA: LamG-like jellyroll fold domain-containing protein, partial [Pyrinomonadaceae bacterium]|nr:LamG-like jellyroll fold domain-containing protein [Pyrinomonadaceae bacterium]